MKKLSTIAILAGALLTGAPASALPVAPAGLEIGRAHV
jgi:hypothetical protein